MYYIDNYEDTREAFALGFESAKLLIPPRIKYVRYINGTAHYSFDDGEPIDYYELYDTVFDKCSLSAGDNVHTEAYAEGFDNGIELVVSSLDYEITYGPRVILLAELTPAHGPYKLYED